MKHAKRVAVIGSGHVGSTTAYALMLRALFEEIVLIDSDIALAEAEAADLADANALARPARIWAGDYRDTATAQIAVITAGAATHGSESRLSVTGQSAHIVSVCVQELMQAGFNGIIVVCSNPVDVMTMVALKKSGFSARRVIGSGTLLDTARLKQLVAEELTVAAGSIQGFVLGEHGDSEVAAFSTIRIGGLNLDAFLSGTAKPDHAAIAAAVRDAGYKIVQGKGYTSFGIATAAVRICEAIVRDEKAVLPVSSFLTGQYGLQDICLSLPCVLGAEGIEGVLVPYLDPEELKALEACVAALQPALETAMRRAGPFAEHGVAIA